MSAHYRFDIILDNKELNKEPIEILEGIEKDTGWIWDDFEKISDSTELRYDLQMSGILEDNLENISKSIWKTLGKKCKVLISAQYLDQIPTETFVYGEEEVCSAD